MGQEKAEELIRKYLEGTATPEEEALLESWYLEMAQEQPDMPQMQDYTAIGEEIAQSLRAEQQEQPKITPRINRWPRVAAAAAIIALSIGTFLLFRKQPAPPIVQRPTLEHDILPAGTLATLTLIDGHAIPIDSGNNNELAHQLNTTLSTLNGQLVYNSTQSPQSVVQGYNTLTTRPGEHYSLLLPDGTKAWLNAASSITYPLAFNGPDRKVKVTGEVYFEIMHNPQQPFTIAVKDQIIEDIGTQLDIKAYDDEPVINTALVEGSVKVIKGTAMTVLTTGYQATTHVGDNKFQVAQIDPDGAIAWKNGYFYFDRADIQTVLRELARWYDMQIIYKGTPPKKVFKGKLYRNINASEALQTLSYFGAHFNMDGRTITVTF